MTDESKGVEEYAKESGVPMGPTVSQDQTEASGSVDAERVEGDRLTATNIEAEGEVERESTEVEPEG